MEPKSVGEKTVQRGKTTIASGNTVVPHALQMFEKGKEQV